MFNSFLLWIKRINKAMLFYGGLVLCLCHNNGFGQNPYYNFRHITTGDGLSNAVIRGITQDKYSYIWIGSVNGLSRYDGYSVKVFLHHSKDPFSIPTNEVRGILSDDNKNIWIVFENGLYRYEYSSTHFIAQQATRGLHISQIIKGAADVLFLATTKGMCIFHTSQGIVDYPDKITDASSKILLQKSPRSIFLHKQMVYLTSDTGLIVYSAISHKAILLHLPRFALNGLEKVMVDNSDNLWISYGDNGGEVLRITNAGAFTTYPEFTKNISNNHISNFFCDSQNRVWVGSSEHGLALYDAIGDNFIFYINDPLQPQTISSHNIADIFQDNHGFLWVGTEGYGVNFFLPDNSLFHTLQPTKQVNLADSWGRVVAEEKNGKLWLGGVSGISLFNPKDGSYRTIQNNKESPAALFSNSIRSLLYDDHELLWIGTSLGLNRYNTKTGRMVFFGTKDKLPLSFYKSILQDHHKNIWIGCRNGLYRFNYHKNSFEHFEDDPLFASIRDLNITSIFEDNRQRIWIGCYNYGLMVYDARKKSIKRVFSGDAISFGKDIRSMAEGRDGKIWVAAKLGIASVDLETGAQKIYNEEDGLTTVNTGGLLIDHKNRLWIGTGKGLYVLDSTRKYFRAFSIKDGLPALEFNEQAAYKATNGDFIFPTLKGFLVFNPDNYKEGTSKVDAFISSFKVFNKEYGTGKEPESLREITLNYKQNFFSLEITGINYGNPQQTNYAYKLEPFDKDWTYTKDRAVNYTNVPGGDYVFRYKASSDQDWNIQDHAFVMHIGTVFYKTFWFWAIMALLISWLVYFIYSYRVAQRERIYALQSKAQRLEKEKAIVQYESLKQQLNPHFLFNSLTSLRSLIRINKENASDFLDKLSLNYRYILKSSESELVILRDELKFTQTYIDLQEARFGKGLQAFIEISEDHLHRKIVPVTIQNLIENAIKHNLTDIDSPLVIRIFTENNYLIVENNLQLKESTEASNKYGLKHLQSLYKFLDDRPLLIEESNYRFTAKIPLI